MKAIVLESVEKLRILDVPMPVLQQGEVLIKVGKCGICGSDVRYFHGENPWAKQTLQKEIPNPPNIILGHELAGTVVDVFHKEDSHLVGKRVGINSFITCGRCHFCRLGQENLCRNTKHLGHGQGWGKRDFYPGGMAEYCPAFADQVYELSDRVSDEQATMLDPIIAALHAVDVAEPKMLDVAAVQGAGPIGLLIAQIMKIKGAKAVAIADVADANLDIAKALGADHVVNAAEQDNALLKLVMKISDELGAQRVFNTVGSSESIIESLQMSANLGVVVLMATRDKEFTVPSLMISGERAIKTSANAMLSDFPKALDLLESGMVKVDPLITHRFPLSRGLEAFEVACNKDRHGAVKVVLDCQS